MENGKAHWSYMRMPVGFAIAKSQAVDGYLPLGKMTEGEAMRKAYKIWTDEPVATPLDPELERTVAGTD